MLTLAFHGAARTVTGSCYELTSGRHRLLVDCGLFQGLKELRERKNRKASPKTHINDHAGFFYFFLKEYVMFS